MKVTNWRRKLASALVAGGLFAPAIVMAAGLNTNLIVDPGFENTDPGDIGPFDGQRLLDWDDSGLDGNLSDDDFAYAYSQNYANPLANGGLHHFSGGFGTTVGQATITQTIDVSTGATGAAIANDEAIYDLSGYFTTYRLQTDSSGLRVRFLDASGQELSRGEVGGFDFVANLPVTDVPIAGQRDWGQDQTQSFVPVGTASVAVEIFSDEASGNHDGYVDKVDFRIGGPGGFLLVLEVNTTTGAVTINNGTGGDVVIDYYEIVSANNSLTSSGWNSLQDQDRADFPAGDGTGNGWEEAGGSSVGGALEADFNSSGSVDGDDFLIWQSGFGTTSGATKEQGDADANGAVNGDDFLIWQSQFGSSGGGGPSGVLSESFLLGDSVVTDQMAVGLGAAYDPAAGAEDLVFRYGMIEGDAVTSELVLGVVRYVGAAGATAVPEPCTCVLVGVACGVLALITPRRSKQP